MATTGWGDESSSGSEDEAPYILPVVEPEEPPKKAASSLQQQASSGRSNRQPPPPSQAKKEGRGGGRHSDRGGGGRHQDRGGRTAAGRHQHEDWKTAAKQASILHRANEQQQPVDGSNWMAQRKKKLEEQKQKEEQLRREQKQQQELESKERRASQLQALNAAMKTIQQDHQPTATTSSSSSLQQAASGEAKTGVKEQPRRPSHPKETSWRERATSEGEKGSSPRQQKQQVLPKAKQQPGEHESPSAGRGRHGRGHATDSGTWRERAAIEDNNDDKSHKGGRGGRGRHGRGGGRGYVSPNSGKPVVVLQKSAEVGPVDLDSKQQHQQKMKVKNMPDGSIVVTKAEGKLDASQKESDDAKGKSSSLQKALHPHETGGRAGREGRGRGRSERGGGRDPSGRGRGAKGGGRDDSGRGRGERGGGRGRGARGRGHDSSDNV